MSSEYSEPEGSSPVARHMIKSVARVRTRGAERLDNGPVKPKFEEPEELVVPEEEPEDYEGDDPDVDQINASLNQAGKSVAIITPQPSEESSVVAKIVDPQKVTANNVQTHSKELISLWILSNDGIDISGDFFNRARKLGEERLKVDFKNFNHEIFEHNSDLVELDIETHLNALGKYRHDIGLEESQRLRGEMSKVLKIFHKTRETIRHAFEVTCETMKAPKVDNSYMVPSNPGTLNSKQLLLFDLYRQASLRGLRKRGNMIYEPIKSFFGLPTHAFKVRQTITQFIAANCNRHLFGSNWEVITGKSFKMTLEDMASTLEHMEDMELMKIEPDSHKFAFKNGVFLTRLDKAYTENISTRFSNDNPKLPSSKWYCKFIPYDSPEFAHISERKCAVNYFDSDLPDMSHIPDWYDIKTPIMQYILQYQLGRRPDAEEVIRNVYMNIGRGMFGLGDLEGWQYALYFKGLAGTGKSTIIEHFLKHVFPPDYRVEISNDVSAQFGLGGQLNNKPDIFLTTFGELDHTCALSLANILQMISGEEISADIKHVQMAITKQWPSHCFFAGNSFPLNWTDKLGALTRRFMILPFLYKVQRKDMRSDLGELILGELPLLIQKCVRAYLECVNENRSKNIWTFCPKIYRETQAALQQQTNILQAFMSDIRHVVVDSCFITSEGDLMEEFKLFAKANNVSQKINGKDLAFVSIVQELSETHGIIVEYKTIDSLEYNNAMTYNGQFFVGIGLTSRLTEEQKRKYLLRNSDLALDEELAEAAADDAAAKSESQSNQSNQSNHEEPKKLEEPKEQGESDQSDHEEPEEPNEKSGESDKEEPEEPEEPDESDDEPDEPEDQGESGNEEPEEQQVVEEPPKRRLKVIVKPVINTDVPKAVAAPTVTSKPTVPTVPTVTSKPTVTSRPTSEKRDRRPSTRMNL